MNTVCVKGIVFSGIGEGKKYVEIYRELIARTLGLDPYPGTLNLRILTEYHHIISSILTKPRFIIPPPSSGMGAVYAWQGQLNGVPVYVLRPEKTRYGIDVVEIISDVFLREKLGLKDNDVVELCIEAC